MAPKKANAFMIFVKDWRKKNPKGRGLTVQEAVTCCGTIWKNMSDQARGPYKSAAKNSDAYYQIKHEPLNCQGETVASFEEREREAANDIVQMKRNIERLILESKKNHDLENVKFSFAAFNYFTKGSQTDIYVPAEFAACEFSLKLGMISVYSSLINPGSCIFGQSCDAMHHTSTTHQLPLPPNALGESDIGKLYGNMLEYLRRSQSDISRPLVVFTTPYLKTIVNSCFRYLESNYDYGDTEILVYDIHYLFYVLKKEVMDVTGIEDKLVNNYVTDEFFVKDFFEYQAGIACQFHEEHDRGKYCTQSMVTRWCYTFSDYMCGDLAITLVPGKHLPPTLKPNYSVHYAPPNSKKDESISSYYSILSRVKKESDQSDNDTAKKSSIAYEPTDHTSFSIISQEFPALNGRRTKSKRQFKNVKSQAPQIEKKHINAIPERLMNAWTVSNTRRIINDTDFDAFKENP